MEEDANVTDTSTSAKRSKLDAIQISSETIISDANETSCSFSNDVDMLECSRKVSETVDSEITEITDNIATDNTNLNEIVSFNNVSIESKLEKKHEIVEINQSNKTEKNINEAVDNDLVKTENDAVLSNNSLKKGDNCNDNLVVNVEEMKVIGTTSNTAEDEAGPSENDTVRKPKNRSRHYRPRRISSSDSSTHNSEGDALDTNVATNSEPEPENEQSEHSNNDDGSDVDPSFSITESSSDSSFHDLNYFESNSDEDDIGSDEVNSIQEVLKKEKPKYKTNLLYEVMYREHGLSGPGLACRRRRDPLAFQSSVCNSRLTIEKLRVMHNLRKHRGCVNSLNFNRSGNILCTGSDDLKIILWDWANNKVLHSFMSGHSLNVFQSKFVDIGGGINIVSSARDGQIRHHVLPPSGSKNISNVLYKHSGPVHKIALCPMNPHEILTAGEDAYIVRCDLREKPIERLVTVRGKNNQRVDLYSIAHNPLDQEFCVCGKDRFVRVYDKRNVKEAIYLMCPEKFTVDNKHHYSYITCAVYNQTGTEILASYNDSDIYLFNNKCYLKGHFTHQYKGHLNCKTIKGVNFFGPNSEYVVSGSDCSNMFIWDKESEVILNWQKGDRSGVVNCLEPHPNFPVLATSGLDYDAKIWCPISETAPPEMEGLEKCVKQNAKRLALNKSDIFNNRTFLFFISECQRTRFRRTRLLDRTTYSSDQNDDYPVVQDIASSSSSEHSTDLDENDEDARMPCTTQ